MADGSNSGGRTIIAPSVVGFVLMNRETFDLLTARCKSLMSLLDLMCQKSMDLLKLDASKPMGLTRMDLTLQTDLNRLRVILRRSVKQTLKSVQLGKLDGLCSKSKSETANNDNGETLFPARTAGDETL